MIVEDDMNERFLKQQTNKQNTLNKRLLLLAIFGLLALALICIPLVYYFMGS